MDETPYCDYSRALWLLLIIVLSNSAETCGQIGSVLLTRCLEQANSSFIYYCLLLSGGGFAPWDKKSPPECALIPEAV